MKNKIVTKLAALGMTSMLAVTCLAGCGAQNNNAAAPAADNSGAAATTDNSAATADAGAADAGAAEEAPAADAAEEAAAPSGDVVEFTFFGGMPGTEINNG